MTRSLKTISIGFPFENSSVVFQPNFSTTKALFDFDVVVVRPYSFVHTGRAQGGSHRVNWPILANAKSEMSRKIEDISRFLSQGGLLVVILDALEIVEFVPNSYTVREIHSATNYDFLSDDFHRCVRNGTGNRIEYVDPADPFAKVIKTSSVEWTAFLNGRPPYPLSDTTYFAKNGAGSYVGGSMETGPGHIVFLPNFAKLDEDAFFEACEEYRFRREGTPPPQWVSSLSLPGQNDLEDRLKALDDDLEKLQKLRTEELAKKDELLAYKKLLFEKGKFQLEPIVRRALDLLKFASSPAETIPGTQFEIDGRTNAGSVPGILEIKGSKNQISLDEFSPFVVKLLADFQSSKKRSKGIVIANGLCLDPPQKRFGKVIFSPHVIEAAKTHSVALVNSVELYHVVFQILGGTALDLPTIREKILTANGYVELFIRTASVTTKF